MGLAGQSNAWNTEHQTVHLSDVVVYRGQIPSTEALLHHVPEPYAWGPPEKLELEHRYVLFCRGAPKATHIVWAADMASWPNFPQY
jgi:hypothetical protein